MADMPVRWVKRAYHHPLWIPFLSVAAIGSLVGLTVLFLLFFSDQRSERTNRINTDLAFCTRGNDLRRQVITIGDANEDMVRGIVDVVLPADATNGERAQLIRELRQQLEPVFDQHRAAVAEIKFIDCSAIPGARTTTTEGP